MILEYHVRINVLILFIAYHFRLISSLIMKIGIFFLFFFLNLVELKKDKYASDESYY